MKKLLVFTDLDGSLLEHDDYRWDNALPAIQLLQQHGYPLIFNSSKTAVEIDALRKQMNNYDPFICENGAVANIPVNYFSPNVPRHKIHHGYEAHLFARSYEQVVSILNELRAKYGFKFRGFHDMSVDTLVAETQLSKEQSFAAKQRQASEPLTWLDSEAALEKFKLLLKIKGLIVTSGGRFLHVMTDVNKGEGVLWLRQQYKKLEPRTQWLTVGLGDSFNDVAMLEVVDYPVFISNPAGKQPEISHINKLIRPELPGPAGWNQSIIDLVNTIA